MRHSLKALLAVLVIGFSVPAHAAIVGEAAPDFTLKDSEGKSHTLSEHKGKLVVLEWTNPGCPFVKKFYEPKAMQKFQADAIGKGVVWYSISSSAEGKEGHLTAETAEKWKQDSGMNSTALLLDNDGKVGQLYKAQTTPHMFVIDTDGKLAYAGAIDDKASTKSEDIAGAKNHVNAALDELLAGKPVSTPSSQPYGCGVKY